MITFHSASFACVAQLSLRNEQCTSAPSRWLARCGPIVVVLLSSLLASCSKHADESAEKSGGQATATERGTRPGATGEVRLDTRLQQSLHLKVEPLADIAVTPEIKGYGRVLDPTPLGSLVTELAIAQAALEASAHEFARVQRLQAQSNASIRAAQTAEAAAVRDRLAVQSARDRLAVTWGRVISQRSDLAALVRALSLQERALVRIDLSAGERLSGPPESARLMGLADVTRSMPAEFLGAAPGTDPQMQGQGFLFLTRDNALQLAPEAAVLGYIASSGEPLHGVLIPRSALIRYAGQSCIYVQTSETAFKRVVVSLTQAAEGGWLISERLKAGDRVVTDGAQLLLSEELKSQMRLGD